MQQKWLPTVFGLVIIVGALMIQVFVPSAPYDNTWFSRVNALWYDMRFQLFAPQRESVVPIVIIDLDEKTQQREGRWPWDRAKVAQLIEALRAYNTALIGFDVVFSEPVMNAANQVIKQLQSAAERTDAFSSLDAALIEQLTQLAPSLDGDSLLADTLGPDTALGFFLHNDGVNSGQLPPAPIVVQQLNHTPELLNLKNYTANLALLNQNMPASGFVVAIPDGDGIVRRMPLLLRHNDGIYHSLSLEMVRLALGVPWTRLVVENINEQAAPVLTAVNLGNQLKVPVDELGQILIPYRGQAGSFPTISATHILQNDGSPDDLALLEGAIVLVGTSALGLADLRTTPLQTSYPGVEVHANVIDTLLNAAWQENQSTLADKKNNITAFYVTPDWEYGAIIAQILIFGLFLSFWLPGRAPRQMMIAASICLTIVLSINILLWHYWHLALPVALVFFTVLFISVINIVFGYFLSVRQKQTIQDLFGEYVPAEHVALMLDNPKEISLAGEQKNMTVLFADIREFTAISESLSPTELKSALNRYLSAVTEVIFAHHGTIDKYVGDLVMAFWNAPLDDPNHANHALQAALAMQKRVRLLREEFAKEGLPQFHIGIGLNTGVMNVGDMGSIYRRAYTVLGDAVNLAARLESLTGFYHLPILVSDTTREQADDFFYRTVDYARVKGRKKPLFISEPVVCLKNLCPKKTQEIALYEQAFQAYQKQHWSEAKAILTQLKKAYPQDPLYQFYLERLAHLDTAHWSPVYTHDSK